jgi:hypothetical protein
MENNIDTNMNNKLPKKRGRKPLSPEQKNIDIEKDDIILTDVLKKELEEKRKKHNDKNNEYYKKNKEKLIAQAKERYYKNKSDSSDLSSNNSDNNDKINIGRKRGRPKGTTGIKKTKLQKDDKIQTIKKIVNMMEKIGEDTTEYVKKIDNLVEEEKKNKPSHIKPIEEINFVHYLKTKTKREFSKQI